MSVLDEILRAKRAEVAELRDPGTARAVRDAAASGPPVRDFTGALRRSDGRVSVVAEFKRRSPSKGLLAADLDPAGTARAYEAGGASALSVLTDVAFFDGSAADLEAARAACALPVLRKDFILDEIQIAQARAMGADAVLLIARAFTDDGLLSALHEQARAAGMAVLVEVHDVHEIERVLAIGAAIVGVNARDLHSFAEDLGGVANLATAVPPEVVAVAESAIRSRADVARMAAAGYDAVLVGEALVRAADPTAALRSLTGIERSVR